MTDLELQLRCQRCGAQMDLRDPAPGTPWVPQQYWVCPACGRHFWTTYAQPTAKAAEEKPAAAAKSAAAAAPAKPAAPAAPGPAGPAAPDPQATAVPAPVPQAGPAVAAAAPAAKAAVDDTSAPAPPRS